MQHLTLNTQQRRQHQTRHCASISFIHPQSDQNKNHKKVSVVKNIIKVINLYLNRPLRVFFPLCLGEKGNEQDPLVL